MITTKEQEKKALEQIKAIIASLGEGSYIATAFEGCLEDAESNIENDFADSMKARYESAKEETEHWYDMYIQEHKDWEAAHAAAHEIAEEKDAEIADLKEQLEKAKAKTLLPGSRAFLTMLVTEQESQAAKNMEKTANLIAELADNPTSDDFKHAVNTYKTAKTRREMMATMRIKFEEMNENE
jgi:hypothetical protein